MEGSLVYVNYDAFFKIDYFLSLVKGVEYQRINTEPTRINGAINLCEFDGEWDENLVAWILKKVQNRNTIVVGDVATLLYMDMPLKCVIRLLQTLLKRSSCILYASHQPSHEQQLIDRWLCHRVESVLRIRSFLSYDVDGMIHFVRGAEATDQKARTEHFKVEKGNIQWIHKGLAKNLV